MNGDTISAILNRVDSVLAEIQPQAVILFWDSDCSDIDEEHLNPKEKQALRETYRSNLLAVSSKILAQGSLLAIAGPELLGEGPKMLDSYWYQHRHGTYLSKTAMLNDYRVINEEVALQLKSVPYIDIRKAFLDAIPEWSYNSGCVTLDGEHPNNFGAIIEANLFSYIINQWLRLSRPTMCNNT